MSMVLTGERLCRFLDERFGVDTADLDYDARLFSDGLLDSFSMVELIAFIETSEGIKVGVMDVQLENLDSIARILRFVSDRTAGAS